MQTKHFLAASLVLLATPLLASGQEAGRGGWEGRGYLNVNVGAQTASRDAHVPDTVRYTASIGVLREGWHREQQEGGDGDP